MLLTDYVTKLLMMDVDLMMQLATEAQERSIVKLNREQMIEGRTSKGGSIQPSYRNVRYAEKKFIMNPRAGFGTPDLKLTGSFHDGMIVNVIGNEYEIASEDPKNAFLPDRYEDIFGLDDTSRRTNEPRMNEELIRQWNLWVRSIR